MTEVFEGSIPPLVTPLVGDRIDIDAYMALADRAVTGGSNGVLVNGTSGEPAILTIGERQQTLEAAISAVAGRVPVIAATGGQSLSDTLTLSEHAVETGADALLVVNPYFTRPNQSGLAEYYLEIAKQFDVPLMIYHIPSRTAVSIEFDTIRRIRDRAPSLIGMKHASTDFNLVTDLKLEYGDDFRVFVGLEDLALPMMTIGAVGLMNAVGNLVPDKVASLAAAVKEGDFVTARSLHEWLFPLNAAVFFDTNPIAIKYMLKRMGLIKENTHRLPMYAASAELERRLDAILESLQLV